MNGLIFVWYFFGRFDKARDGLRPPKLLQIFTSAGQNYIYVRVVFNGQIQSPENWKQSAIINGIQKNRYWNRRIIVEIVE